MSAREGVSLACPNCHADLHMAETLCTCVTCDLNVPYCEGYVFFTEASEGPATSRIDTVIGSRRARYEALLERRRERLLTEPYAWFRPFNESSCALDPFRELLSQTVPAGAPILDLWCRTGWTGELLASWFPDSQVVSLWEGDHDVLGYPGFLRWLPREERAPNLEVIFSNPNQPLPFSDGHFGFVHGLDTLHRYPHEALLAECLRVAAQDAPLIFPHVHLTNSEPDPYFDRGCTQLHGTEWGAILDNAGRTTNRRSLVLSEKDLYQTADAYELADNRNTPHYNGLIVLAPPSWDGETIGRSPSTPGPNDFLFVNPMVTMSSTLGSLQIDPRAQGGSVGHMCDRHPVAVESLTAALGSKLSSLEAQILSHSTGTVTVSQLAESINQPVETISQAAGRLVDERVLCAAAVSPAMARLQRHYRTARPEKAETFADLWRTLEARYGNRSVLMAADGSSFGVEDLLAIVDAVRSWLKQNRLEQGAIVAICAKNRAESLFIVWASWLAGLTVLPIRPEPGRSSGLLFEIEVDAVFCDGPSYDAVSELASRSGAPCVVLDAVDGLQSGMADQNDQISPPPPVLQFEELIAAHLGADIEAATAPRGTHLAALIPTSGSTGPPKIVQLSMGSLLHTGSTFVRSANLNSRDRLLSLGSMHTMSGLRNPATAALLSGATILVDMDASDSVLAAVEACAKQQATVLCVGPAFVGTLSALSDRVEASSLQSVRLLTTTADRVDAAALVSVADRYDVATLDYYGLTETGGIVMVGDTDAEGSLGWAAGAAVEVHNDGDRAAVGEPGEIRVSGPSLMMGYRTEPESGGVSMEDGWVNTGDRGIVRSDGSIDLLDRMDEQMKRRDGEIFPRGAVLATVSALEGVISAAVEIDAASSQILLRVTVSATAELTAGSIVETVREQLGSIAVPDRTSVNLGETRPS